jgi:hypothetical protein
VATIFCFDFNLIYSHPLGQTGFMVNVFDWDFQWEQRRLCLLMCCVILCAINKEVIQGSRWLVGFTVKINMDGRNSGTLSHAGNGGTFPDNGGSG